MKPLGISLTVIALLPLNGRGGRAESGSRPIPAAVAPPDNPGWLEHVASAGVELGCPEPWFWQLQGETDAQTAERFKLLVGGKGCIIFQPESPHPSDDVFMGWGGTTDHTYSILYLTDTPALRVWDGKAVKHRRRRKSWLPTA